MPKLCLRPISEAGAARGVGARAEAGRVRDEATLLSAPATVKAGLLPADRWDDENDMEGKRLRLNN